jgi:hypothetical protein
VQILAAELRSGLDSHVPDKLQSQGEQGNQHAVAISPPQLHQITPARSEREHITTKRIFPQRYLRLGRQRVNAAAHVRDVKASHIQVPATEAIIGFGAARE